MFIAWKDKGVDDAGIFVIFVAHVLLHVKTTGHPVNLNFPSRSDRAAKIELWALATWRFAMS